MKKRNIFFLALGLVLLGSCTDLNTIPEGGTLTEEQKREVVEAIPGRLAADINGMFAVLSKQYCVFGAASGRDDDHGYPAAAMSWDLNGPDMVGTDDNYNWFSVASDYADRTYTYANPYMRWAMFYKQIKMANDVMASIPEDTDNPTLLTYRGLAHAVRAFDYFSLVQYYQFTYGPETLDKPAVPIVEPGMTDVTNPRATVRQVYELIMNDIDTALVLLKDYVPTSKSYISEAVAYGLRARVNLVMKNYAQAALDARKAIDLFGGTPYTREELMTPGFIDATDHNWMWALIITPDVVPDAYPAWPAVLASFSGDSYTCGVGCYKMINTLLYSIIPATDVRKGWWVDSNLKSPLIDSLSWPEYKGEPLGPLNIPDVKMPYLPYTNVKFGQFGGIGNTVNAGDWCMMRVEEMLLIEAEATGMTDEAAGKNLLTNFVKTYRDPAYTFPASGIKFQDECWKQRRIELWGEGFSMMDIMRLKKNIVRFNSRVETNHPEAFRFNLAADDGWLLMRIPQREINSNPGISDEDNNNDGALPVSGDGAGLRDGVTD
jgi:hypothetical protein